MDSSYGDTAYTMMCTISHDGIVEPKGTYGKVVPNVMRLHGLPNVCHRLVQIVPLIRHKAPTLPRPRVMHRVARPRKTLPTLATGT